MTLTITKPLPKILVPGAGDCQTLLTHTIVWKLTGDDTNDRYAMAEVTDTEGGGAPVHCHPWEETFYILEGEIEILVGNHHEVLGAGAVCHIPANTLHDFKVCSPSARALVMVAPAAAEAFYREVSEKITSLPPDPTVFGDICFKHGVRLQ